MTLLHHRLTPPLRRDAPTLLLIHPMGASLAFWDGCTPLWRQHFGILAYDQRCAGQSPCAASPPGLDQHAADIEELRAAHGVTRFAIVACAVGCMVAATYAARHADRVIGMVLANPTPRTGAPASAALQARAASVLQGGMAAILPAAVERPFEAQPRDARYDAYLAAFGAQDPEAYAASVRGYAAADARAAFAAIACTTLLVPARHDLLLPPPLADDCAALMRPGLARIVLDTEGAHFLPYQRPDAFATRARDFLLPLTAQAATQGA